MVSGEIQAVIMAAGKGSRMLDITGGGVKCLVPVSGFPLLYYTLRMLERSGFTNLIVTVPDSVRSEVSKLPEKYKLNLKLEVVGVPAVEEWGTLETLRHIGDKLTGSDLLIVSGDLITRENIRKLSDLHRAMRSGLTILVNRPAFDLKTSLVPGSKSNKYKKERDLIGLTGNTLCLFKSEADIEDEINIPSRILRQNPRFTVHTNLEDAHVYIVKKWILDEILADKTLTAVKGEMIPKLVELQFKATEKEPEDRMEVDTVQDRTCAIRGERQFCCYAAVTEEPTVRVNNIPSYWEAFRLLKEGVLNKDSDLPDIHELAMIHERCQMKECSVGSGSVVSEKTTLTGVSVGANCTIQEKVKLVNCIVMDGVTVASGSNIKDSILCEGSSVEPGCELSSCIVGKQFKVPASSSLSNQILLDSDRMMHV